MNFLLLTSSCKVEMGSNWFAKEGEGWLWGLFNGLQAWVCIRITWRVCSNTSQGPTPRVFGPVDLGQEWRVCISNKFSGDANAAGLLSILYNSWFTLWQLEVWRWSTTPITVALVKEVCITFPVQYPCPHSPTVSPSRPCDPVDIRLNQFCSSGRLLFLLAGE